MEEVLQWQTSETTSAYSLPPPPPPTAEQLSAVPRYVVPPSSSIRDGGGDPHALTSKAPSSVRRFLIINSAPPHRRRGNQPASPKDKGDADDAASETAMDPARALLSHDREVRLRRPRFSSTLLDRGEAALCNQTFSRALPLSLTPLAFSVDSGAAVVAGAVPRDEEKKIACAGFLREARRGRYNAHGG